MTAAAKRSNGDGRTARKALDGGGQQARHRQRQCPGRGKAAGERRRCRGHTDPHCRCRDRPLRRLGLLGVIVMFGITRPLNSLVSVLQRMAKGEVDAQIPEAARGDESVRSGVRSKASETWSRRRRLSRPRSSASPTKRRPLERKRTMVELADGFERAVGGVLEHGLLLRDRVAGNRRDDERYSG